MVILVCWTSFDSLWVFWSSDQTNTLRERFAFLETHTCPPGFLKDMLRILIFLWWSSDSFFTPHCVRSACFRIPIRPSLRTIGTPRFRFLCTPFWFLSQLLDFFIPLTFCHFSFFRPLLCLQKIVNKLTLIDFVVFHNSASEFNADASNPSAPKLLVSSSGHKLYASGFLLTFALASVLFYILLYVLCVYDSYTIIWIATHAQRAEPIRTDPNANPSQKRG